MIVAKDSDAAYCFGLQQNKTDWRRLAGQPAVWWFVCLGFHCGNEFADGHFKFNEFRPQKSDQVFGFVEFGLIER